MISRRGLQVALGLIWLLDACLQFQPFMFSSGFATSVVLPAAQGNPRFIASSVAWGAHQILEQPILENAAFATGQLALALGILWRPTVKPALAASIVWALAVWWFGEGLGGVLTGQASPLTGAPGAALLYAVAALLVWPRPEPPGRVAGLVWVVLWGSLACFAIQSAARSPGALSIGCGGLLAVCTTAVLLPIALERAVLVCSIALGLLIALVGDDLGGLFTGTATDPGTGPLLVLLALVFWPGRPKNAQAPSMQATRRRTSSSLTRQSYAHW